MAHRATYNDFVCSLAIELLWDEVGYNLFRSNCQYIQYTYIPVVQGVSDYYIPFLFMTKTFNKMGIFMRAEGRKE
jgi:hypothetical protein